MTITLDGRQMTNRETAHDHIKAQLSLPEYYGRNLDALYDLLTEWQEQTTIRLLDRGGLAQNLGVYAEALMQTLRDAARVNPRLKIAEE